MDGEAEPTEPVQEASESQSVDVPELPSVESDILPAVEVPQEEDSATQNLVAEYHAEEQLDNGTDGEKPIEIAEQEGKAKNADTRQDSKEDNEDSFPPLPNIEPETSQEGKNIDQNVVQSSPHGATTKPTKNEPIKYNTRKVPQIRPTEVMYKAAAPISRIEPRLKRNMYKREPRYSSNVAALMWGGPDKEIVSQEKHDLCQPAGARSTWDPNPTVTAPMRAHKWRGVRTWGGRMPSFKSDWQHREELVKDRKDHDVAVELGYETLVGNIQYIPIPRLKDMNRSWQNFLSDDPMEWGFPYLKGSKERPRLKLPEPYLAHQMKERLWKFPRTKILQAQED